MTSKVRVLATTSRTLAVTGALRCGGPTFGPFRRFLRRDSLGHRIPVIGLALPVIGVRPAVAVRPLVVPGGLVWPPAEVDRADARGEVQLHAGVHVGRISNSVTRLISFVVWDSMLDDCRPD